MKAENYRKGWLPVAAVVVALAATGCSDSTSPDQTIMAAAFMAGPVGGNGEVVADSVGDISQINIVSARVVIGRVEARGANDTVVFISPEHEPEIVELDLTGSRQIVDIAVINPGEYSSSLIRMEKLEPADSATWNANPEMQNYSLRVEGYLNGDTAQTFLFTTELDEEQVHDFAPLTIADKGSATVTFHFDYTLWFQDGNGGLVNPDNEQLASARSIVEENIVNSFDVD